MTDQQTPQHPRRTTAIIIGVLVLVIAAVTVIGIVAAGAPKGGATTPPPVAGSTVEPGSTTSSTAIAPAPTDTPKPVKQSAKPTPQPTKTATITKPTAVPIKKALSAAVVKLEAVKGTADGPGEIGGPSVRFTIKITNTTGKTFTLSNTVVNAYYGKAATPAVQLRQPGGKDFPQSVKNGSSATGVFIFNIPKADRGSVKITVDTAVQNPVIAFEGAAPKG